MNFFEELIRKHSNEGDIVLDTFLGAGTTAIACEVETNYYEKIITTIS